MKLLGKFKDAFDSVTYWFEEWVIDEKKRVLLRRTWGFMVSLSFLWLLISSIDGGEFAEALLGWKHGDGVVSIGRWLVVAGCEGLLLVIVVWLLFLVAGVVSSEITHTGEQKDDNPNPVENCFDDWFKAWLLGSVLLVISGFMIGLPLELLFK